MLRDIQNNFFIWQCFSCVSDAMPFSHIDINELFLELENKPSLINTTPNFTMQSLLDQMPGQNFETDEFTSESISSKYLTPSEFLEQKFSAKNFSMIHINITSLGKHIDELRSFICTLITPLTSLGSLKRDFAMITPW